MDRLRAWDEDGLLVKREFRNAATLARLAVERGLTAGGHSRLLGALDAAVAEHRQLWRARNRPGGLAENCAHFKAAR